MTEPLYFIHGMLHYLQRYDDLPDKHKSFFEALSGMGLVEDHEVVDVITKKQAESIALEFISRVYQESE